MEKNILRKVQMVQLEILKEIKRICEKNEIEYFLDSGTLLGAVRHQGFIPWDDDLDIGMLRRNYDRFLEVVEQELDERYELVEWESDAEYPHAFCKIMKKNTIYLEEAQHGNAKCGIYVDVFPYDFFPSDYKMQRKQGTLIMIYRAIIRAKCKHRTWRVHNTFLINKWLKNLPFRFLSVFYTKKKLIRNYTKIATMCSEVESEMFFPQGTTKYGKWLVPAECFWELSQLQFEDDCFMAPKNADLYLKHAYGDYMKLPPESERENRHSIIKVEFDI